MARLPLVFETGSMLAETRDWLAPADVEEAFRIQPRCVWPDLRSFRCTVVATVFPGMMFLRYVLPRAAAPGSSAVCSLWAVTAVLAFVIAAFSNPGVVPRKPHKHDAGSTPNAKKITLNGVLVSQRWCSTCRIHRPLRSKHCAFCDRCVFRFDHHCTWLGNCVGLGNYRAFLTMVLTASLFFGHSLLITLLVLRYDLTAADAWLGGWRTVLRRIFIVNAGKSAFAGYSLVMFFAFFVLLLYHAIIIGCNLTTNEHVRDYYLTRNPFDVSCTKNYRQVLCMPYGRPPRIETGGLAPKHSLPGVRRPAVVSNGKGSAVAPVATNVVKCMPDP